jgi:hypothetical protein
MSNGLEKIEDIIVLMLVSSSFDHILGYPASREVVVTSTG